LSTARDYRPAPERSDELADRIDRPALGLERRLARLPDGHPSAAGYADRRGRPDEIRPLTDAEHAEHVTDVKRLIRDARSDGLATDRTHTIDPDREFWSAEREAIHDEIVDDLYGRAQAAPCDREAIVAGGLAGAGKTTVLTQHAGIDLSRYLMINPDDVKEELAHRGLVPVVNGLTAMEAADLVHEESSHIAKRLAVRAQGEGKNVIWDITMSSEQSTSDRLDRMRAAGYTRIEGIFVDIPVEVSMRRADARHREGHDDFRAGMGLGGRFVPNEMIAAQADMFCGSSNRRVFEQVKQRFDRWCLYDNSIDGREPVLLAAEQREDEKGQA
jgi:predicted kinase